MSSDDLVWISHGAGETHAIGLTLGRACRGGETILLEGPLGAGKTVVAQGVAAGLDVQDPVTSPTFTLLKEYRGRLPLAHFDFYRVEPQRAVDLEFSDYIGGAGVCVVEWASRVPQILPADYLLVELRYGEATAPPETRLVRARAAGSAAGLLQVLEAWRRGAGRDEAREAVATAEGGHAGTAEGEQRPWSS